MQLNTTAAQRILKFVLFSLCWNNVKKWGFKVCVYVCIELHYVACFRAQIYDYFQFMIKSPFFDFFGL